jgi:hypothetical protein
MEIVFGIVVVAVSVISAVVACLTYLRVGDLYRQIGRSYLPELDGGGLPGERAGTHGSKAPRAH